MAPGPLDKYETWDSNPPLPQTFFLNSHNKLLLYSSYYI